jgi:putative ATPase
MNKPLAYRMRPKTLDQVIGQEKIVGPQGFLSNCLNSRTIVSCILYGPPGTGKTTIAEAFANSLNVHHISLNATFSSKDDLLSAFKEAAMYQDTIIIMDEIHRLNKDRQDLLLSRLEDGTFYLIGATTENPMLAINPAIRSRTHLLEVKPLTPEEVETGLKRAVSSPDGLDSKRQFTPAALKTIARLCGGDLRYAYNILEAASLSSVSDKPIGVEEIKNISAVPNYFGDKDGNEHYDTVSAFQKSIRGSEVDAAVYYLAKMCASGDLEGLIRRLMVTAYEDVGLANPPAVDRCYHACEVAREVGFPEAIIPLSFTVCDLALSPKSKSAALAVEAAMDEIQKHPSQVRDYLKLTPVNVQEEDKYPYDRPDLWEYIEYLPEGLEKMKFYKPWLNGNYEKSLNINYERLEKQLRSTSLRLLKEHKKS